MVRNIPLTPSASFTLKVNDVVWEVRVLGRDRSGDGDPTGALGLEGAFDLDPSDLHHPEGGVRRLEQNIPGQDVAMN